MSRVTIVFTHHSQEDVWVHLRSNVHGEEEAAFLLANTEATSRGVTFYVRDWYRVAPDDFAERGIRGIELTDERRAWLLKRAHDEECSLIECHSHPGPGPAAFSSFDIQALTEFVPHVRWRLKGRPYAAIVVADTSFDALAWVDSRTITPRDVHAVTTDNEILYPTRRSVRLWEEMLHGSTV